MKVALFAVLTLLFGGVAAADVSVASPAVAISPGDTPAQIRQKAASVTPSARQLAWQRLELTAFVHFGINTYTAREHGTGTENPNDFQPDQLNPGQWASALRSAGFKLVILTVKHHDGFLLFPSRYSSFGVASSSWRGGTGDVVREFADAVRAQGLKVGVYISPSDLHEAQPGGRFGNGSAAVARTIPTNAADVVGGRTFPVTADDYNTYFMNNLYELLTRYGVIDEVWWDGANPTGKSNPYNHTDWIRIVRTLQPQAVMFQDIDNRWVGNEDGVGRVSEWSPIPLRGEASTAADRFLEPEDERAADIGGDTVLAQRDSDGTSKWDVLRWTPSECDTSIYPDGWFYPYTSIKTPAQLEDTYYTSVGRNCQLLLNVGPDRHGVLDGPTVDALTTFGTTISSTFAVDFARGAATSAPAVVDGNPDTSWQLGAGTGSVELDLGADRTFNVINIQEDMAVGMRTQSFAVDSWTGSAWTQIAADTTIGYKKLVRLASPVTTRQVRLRITGSRAAPAIATFGLHSRGVRSGPVTSGLSGKCLDTDGARAQIWDCNGTNAQNWTVGSDGSLQASGKCLDIYGGSSANGAVVQLYTCNGLGHQKWTASGGALVNPQSGRCLDVPGFNSTNGTQLVLWDCNGGANQRWTVTT